MNNREAYETLSQVAFKHCSQEELASVMIADNRLRELIKKEDPKSVVVVKGEGLEPLHLCPKCGSTFVKIYKDTRLQRCGHCGQALEWN